MDGAPAMCAELGPAPRRERGPPGSAQGMTSRAQRPQARRPACGRGRHRIKATADGERAEMCATGRVSVRRAEGCGRGNGGGDADADAPRAPLALASAAAPHSAAARSGLSRGRTGRGDSL